MRLETKTLRDDKSSDRAASITIYLQIIKTKRMNILTSNTYEVTKNIKINIKPN